MERTIGNVLVAVHTSPSESQAGFVFSWRATPSTPPTRGSRSSGITERLLGAFGDSSRGSDYGVGATTTTEPTLPLRVWFGGLRKPCQGMTRGQTDAHPGIGGVVVNMVAEAAQTLF